MNSYSDQYVDFNNPQPSYDKNSEPEISMSSPNSDSTALYGSHHSPQLQNNFYYPDQPIFNTISPENEYTYQQNGALYKDFHYSSDESDPLGIRPGTDATGKSKSDRAAKRQIAKERRKQKMDEATLLQGVDPKFIPEGFDDPNLDEKTKKKMLTMIRNRVSAQNSRERKKVYMNQLEDINADLQEKITMITREKAGLIEELKRTKENEAALIREVESLRQNNICASCRRGTTDNFIEAHDGEAEQNGDENLFVGGMSMPSSPLLTRFSSAGRGFFTFLAFTAIIGMIVVMNVQPSTNTLFDGQSQYRESRILEVKNTDVCHKIETPSNVIVDPRYAAIQGNALVTRNIAALMNNFDSNYEQTFQSHMKNVAILNAVNGNAQSIIQYDDIKLSADQNSSQSIIALKDFASSNLRKKEPVIISKTLPVITQKAHDDPLTSTLFCPNAMEFTNKEIVVSSDGSDDTALVNKPSTLEMAEFIQLIVPKKSLVSYNVNNNVSNMYDLPPTNEEDNSQLEIWCKVFSIREVTSSF